jgi:hypothetical protein
VSFAERRSNLADAGERRPRRGRRTLFAVTFAVVAGAHMLLLVRFPAQAHPVPLATQTPVVSIDLASLAASAETGPPIPAPPPPAVNPPDPAPDPPATPAPSPPAPAPDAKPDLNSLTPPPLDLTTEPMQLTPSVNAPMTAAPDAVAKLASDAGATCDLTATLQAALQANEAVRNDLAAIPQASRSVANAVQLWNGAWVDAQGIGGDAVVGPIRAAIVAVVEQAPAACHDRSIAGPRLLTITDPRGTVIIAIGSDIWRWSDLSRPAPEKPLL